MQTNNICKAISLPIYHQYSLLKATIPTLVSKATKSSVVTHIFFCLDKSGSMSGRAIMDAKEAAKAFLRELENAENIAVHLIPFDSCISPHSSTDSGMASLIEYVDKIEAGGGTMFSNVLAEIQSILNKYEAQKANIIFLTDGEDNDGIAKLTPKLVDFKKFIDTNQIGISIHSIGFGSSHDAVLLSKLTEYGTTQGTFQFIEESALLIPAVKGIMASMDISSVALWGHLIDSSGAKLKLAFEEPKDNTVVCSTFVDSHKTLNSTIMVKSGDVSCNYSIQIEESKETLTDLKKLEQYSDLIESFFLTISFQISQNTAGKDDIKDKVKTIKELDDSLDMLCLSTKTLNRIDRRHIINRVRSIKERLVDFYTLTQSYFEGKMSNTNVAKLNSLAFKGVLLNKHQKTLVKRQAQNTTMLEDIENQVSLISKAYDITKIEQKYKDIDKFGYCILCCNTWLDAIKNCDCLCITFDATRTQLAISDPSELIVKTINTAFLTSECFISSAIYQKGKTEQLNFTGDSLSKLVSGLPNEIINGIMPIYINEEHWKIASQIIKPMLGWTAALDVLAFAPMQLLTIPYIIYAKAIHEASSEHKQFMKQVIHDTCLAIYKDNKDKIFDEIMKKHNDPTMSMKKEISVIYSNYLSKGEYRTVHYIPNNAMFLSKLLICWECKDIELDPNILKIMQRDMIEEELRRIVVHPITNTCKYLTDILGVDPMIIVNRYGELMKGDSFKKQMEANKLKNDFAQLLIKEKLLVGTTSSTIKAKSETDNKLDAIDPIVYFDQHYNKENSTDFMMEMLASYKEAMKSERIALINAAMRELNIPEITNLKDLGIQTTTQFQLLAIQNYMHSKNIDRYHSFVDHTYVSPFSNYDTCIAKIKSMFVRTVEERKNSLVSNDIEYMEEKRAAKAIINAQNDAEAAVAFYMEDPVALHTLLGKLFAKGIPCTNILSKLRLLRTGVYSGHKLFKGDGSEITKTKFVYQTVKNYKSQGTLDEWINVFSTCDNIAKNAYKCKRQKPQTA